jgi:hypothetical protein
VIGIDDLEEEESVVGKKIVVVDHHVSVRVLVGEKNRGGAVVRLPHWKQENIVVVACDDLFVRGGLLAATWNERVVLPVVVVEADDDAGGLPEQRLLREVLDYVVARPYVPVMVYVVAWVHVVVDRSSRRLGGWCGVRDRDCRRGAVVRYISSRGGACCRRNRDCRRGVVERADVPARVSAGALAKPVVVVVVV